MLQLWKFVLLCGLLTGTSASLFGDPGSFLKNVIEKGHELSVNTVEIVTKKLKEDLIRLQDSKIWQLPGKALEKADDLLASAVSKVLEIRKDILGLSISNVQLLGVKANPTSDGAALDLSFPISADVGLDLPLIGKTADLKLSLDLLSNVKIETQDGNSKVAVTKCVSNPASLSLSLSDERSKLANGLVDAASSFVSQSLFTLVEAQICPLVRLFAGTLSVDFVQGAIDELKNGSQQQSSA